MPPAKLPTGREESNNSSAWLFALIAFLQVMQGYSVMICGILTFYALCLETKFCKTLIDISWVHSASTPKVAAFLLAAAAYSHLTHLIFGLEIAQHFA